MFALNLFEMCLPWALSCQELMAGNVCWVWLWGEELSCRRTCLDPRNQNSTVAFSDSLSHLMNFSLPP